MRVFRKFSGTGECSPTVTDTSVVTDAVTDAERISVTEIISYTERYLAVTVKKTKS